MTSQSNIAQELIQNREEQNISQRELAKRAGTTQAVISRVENGQVNPSVGLLERISSALGQSLDISTSPTVDKIKHKLVGEYHSLNNIHIHAQSLQHNFKFFQKENPQARIAPVLKANAYGHGLVQVGEWVDQNLSVPYVCVDSLFEAYRLKNKGVETPILVLGYTDPNNFRVFTDFSNIHFVAFDLDTIQALSKYQPQAQIHIKIDTGMNRLGLLPNQVPEFIKEIAKYKSQVTGIYSHFSQADSENNKFTFEQVATLKSMIQLFEASKFTFKYKHIAATAGSFLTKDPEFNLIRLGLGFYGYSPFTNTSKLYADLRTKLKPALSLSTKIAQIKTVEEGRAISYAGTYITTKKKTLAILPIGYYDGISRRLSNKGWVYIKRKPCPILGNVTMNQTIVDVSHLTQVRTGDSAEIINPNLDQKNSIYQQALNQKTIPYTVLTSLSETTKRKFI